MPNQHGEFIWYELATDNADAAQHFYSAILGWRVTDSGQPGVDYRILHAPDEDTGEWRPIGGVMPLSEEMKQCGARAISASTMSIKPLPGSPPWAAACKCPPGTSPTWAGSPW